MIFRSLLIYISLIQHTLLLASCERVCSTFAIIQCYHFDPVYAQEGDSTWKLIFILFASFPFHLKLFFFNSRECFTADKITTHLMKSKNQRKHIIISKGKMYLRNRNMFKNNKQSYCQQAFKVNKYLMTDDKWYLTLSRCLRLL